jgi:hypothetical protein
MIRLADLQRYARLLDTAFRIPGTRIRFGLDPIIGLIPGLGDLASPVFAGMVILEGARLNVPRIILMRMAVNALVDAVVGAIPLIGIAGDVFVRANTRNLALLERYAVPGTVARKADYWFVWTVLAALVIGVILIVIAAIWLLGLVWNYARQAL